ncbi:MAG: PrsW family glutamic-type intramembrane protease [Terracidiphilus sp.]|nr:PrsW family glutamic-type intramembrane protease [Terracidiphilus sp.]MDR3796717.1 PrsW family glutamic-type intramembrane protease [Terracidiphilus sp.]
MSAASSPQAAASFAAAPQPSATPAAYPGAYPGAQAPPPGMVPVTYQAYPGGPQQVYYVPAQGMQPHGGVGLLQSIQAQIRHIASTDQLEGFSLSQTFSETFKHHDPRAEEEYAMVGSALTTPPIEMVDTSWPKPWMFFRMLMLLGVAALVLWGVFYFTGQKELNLLPALVFMGAFAMPLATLVFIFEMNTPRNVSVIQLGKLFLVGGVVGLCMAILEYQVQAIANFPGPIEESSKLLAVILVMYGMRGAGYKFELNGILFGCAAGAGFACFETCGYALFNSGAGFVSVLQTETIQAVAKLAQGQITQTQAVAAVNQATTDAVASMVSLLELRGVLAPFGHPVWTAIAAGAFWRVKQDRPTSLGMLTDGRFLMAFLIPVLMHTLWDITVTFPNLFNPTTDSQQTTDNWVLYGIMAFTAVISWYVLFTMIQQGLNQVRDVKKAQLQATLNHVEATLGLGQKRFAV